MGHLGSDEILDLLCYLNKQLSEKEFYRTVSSPLKALDLLGFGKELHSWLEKIHKSSRFAIIQKKLQHLASSIQYDSPIFGRWLRIRFVHVYRYWKDSILREAEHDYFEEAHEIAPKHANLLFSADLEKPAQVQFGSEQISGIKYFAGHLGKPDEDPGVLYVGESLWMHLQKVVTEKLNARKLVLEEKDYKLSSLPSDLRHFIKNSFKNYLKVILRQPPERPMDPLALFRLFVFTFFYSIIQRSDILPCIYHLIIPVNFGGEHVGSYCGAFGKTLDKKDVDQLTRLYQAFINALLTLELLNIEEIGTAKLTVTEDIIRLCTRVIPLDDKLPAEMTKSRRKIEDLIRTRHGKGVDALRDPGLTKIRDTMLSANSRFLALLDDLGSTLGWFGTEAKSVFLYSERGLGKELLASLCHYLSKRSVANSHVKKFVQRALDGVNSRAYDTYFNGLVKKGLLMYDRKRRKYVPNWTRFRTNRKEFNFRIRNASTLSEKDYKNILWGDAEPGLMWEVHVLGGTLFLDEINTIKPEVANGILRCLENPFQIVPKAKPPLSLNLLYVFASNYSPEELRKDLREPRLNPAFLDRITRQSFYVPPLRERREDIALIFNAEVREKNKQLRGTKVSFIDLDAIRLLVELEWRRNIRDIKDLIDEIFSRRISRGLTGGAARRITFEELIYAVTKRRLI